MGQLLERCGVFYAGGHNFTRIFQAPWGDRALLHLKDGESPQLKPEGKLEFLTESEDSQ